MTIAKLSWKNLTSSPLNTSLSLLLMTFGVGIISLLFLLNNQVQQQLQRNLRGIDMVVGAKGSPLQLILSSVYHIDNPTGNISYDEANAISENAMVETAIPLSFGDSYNGFRIVGTTHDYVELYQGTLKEGQLWNYPLEVVLGSAVAEAHQLQLGDTFYGTHGLVEGGHAHDDHIYYIVGILEASNTVLDNLVLTNTESVWEVHNHGYDEEHQCDDPDHHHQHDESDHQHSQPLMITSMLISFKSPVALLQLPRKINETTNLQAAVPSFEINRLISLLGFGIQSINIIAIIIILVSGLSIFISLYNSLKKRRYELALMRVHGASRWQVVQLVLQEGLILSLLGTILGVLISRLALIMVPLFIDKKYGMESTSLGLLSDELWLLPLGLLVGVIASLVPIIQSFNINIPKTLSNG